MVNLGDYDYALPPELIAQYPADERDHSRLMVLDGEGAILHRTFRDIGAYLSPGDLLVVNDTKVFPARLIGRKNGAGGEVEIFLLHPSGNGSAGSPTCSTNTLGCLWEALSRPSRRLREGAVVLFGDGILSATVEERGESGHIRVRLESDGDITSAIDVLGRIPLPPYIRREPDERDRERYQTVYACHRGAVAAPTAGLHFTRRMLDTLSGRGIASVPVTLHVGTGTFRPLTGEDARKERLHREFCRVSETVVSAVRSARERGGRVVAVGTTTVRALETASSSGDLRPFEGWTDLFIKPPYRFRTVDALITNFHLPRSSLLMLVSAFAGRERLLEAYRIAVEERYRFYSYGDAMLILKVR